MCFNHLHTIRATGLAMAYLALFAPPSYAAEDIFTSREFMTWDYESQAFYIRTSVGMAGMIVGQTSKSQEQCLEKWYVSHEKTANQHVLSVMRDYPDFHPRGVILAIMEKKCGQFAYRK